MRTYTKVLLTAFFLSALSTIASGSVITINCLPTAITNSTTVANAVDFINASGTGSFACSDASLGAHTLNSVTVSLFSDYQFGNGTNSDPVDNSAGFTFTDGTATWALAHGSPLLPNTTMNLAGGVTTFVVGNANSQVDTFTNTTSGGIGGTSYVVPMVDSQTGSLVGVFAIPVRAFIDVGGFANGVSTARVTVTYDYTSTGLPEPVSMALVGVGLLGVGFAFRRRML